MVGSLVTVILLFGCVSAQEWDSVYGRNFGQPCYKWQQKYVYGQIFKRPGSIDCTEYICGKSSVRIHKTGCRWNGQCRAVGYFEGDSNCTTYTCKPIYEEVYEMQPTYKKPNTCCVEGTAFQDGKNFIAREGSECIKYHCSKGEYTFIKKVCIFRDKCYDVWDSVKDINLEDKKDKKCTKYMCIPVNKDGITFYEMSMKIGCQWRRKCLDLGDTVEKNKCKKYTCKKNLDSHNHFVYDMEEKTTGCEVNGTCYTLGDIRVKRCRTSTCTKSGLNPTDDYVMNLTQTRCRDRKGNCHRSGSGGHRIKYRGQWRRNCKCNALNNGTAFYSCPN